LSGISARSGGAIRSACVAGSDRGRSGYRRDQEVSPLTAYLFDATYNGSARSVESLPFGWASILVGGDSIVKGREKIESYVSTGLDGVAW
jgi:hypothetical protein